MPLSAGTRLGSYEVIAAIGAGGMGQVYRARDTRLDRDVAIKALPDLMAGDPERVLRFEREAKVLAALNHPHIGAIYGVEEANESRYLVLEFVEGQSLADRLRAGPLPIDEAVAIAFQLLDALEAAHEKGIIHRDLKPANIMLTADGHAKVLDFGLARIVESETAGESANSPTMSLAGTRAGVILGTAGYMSPEQAKGRVADKRSDVWAFGCVLFEMLTGRRVFDGEDVSETLAAVLRAEPDWSRLPADLPAGVRTLLMRCLERDRKARIPEIAAVRFLLQDALSQSAGAPLAVPTLAAQTPVWQRALPIVAIAVLAAAGGAAVAWYLASPPAPIPQHLTVMVPEGSLPPGVNRSQLAVSPDGTQIVYSTYVSLYLRPLSDDEPRAIQGTDVGRVMDPVFSPDGQSIAFQALRAAGPALMRVPIAGGTASTICAVNDLYGLSWDESGIIFAQRGRGIMRVSPEGGDPQLLVNVKADEVVHGPQMLPDGDTVLFSVTTGTDVDRWDKARIVAHSLKSGKQTLVIDGGSAAQYLPTGHLVYAVSGTLFAVAFDPTRLKPSGSRVPVIEGVRRTGAAGGSPGIAQYGVSRSGVLVYIAGPVSAWVTRQGLGIGDRSGKSQQLEMPTGIYESPRLSPDGTQVAFTRLEADQSDIWTLELGGGGVQRLTFGGNNRDPIWSRDGTHILFQSARAGAPAIFMQPARRPGVEATQLTEPASGEAHSPDAWSPTSDRFLYSVKRGDEFSVWTYSLQDRKSAPFGIPPVRSRLPPNAVYSPDGRFVAYVRLDGPRSAVYVEPDPPTGAVYQLPSQEAPHEPTWSPDTPELFYNPRPEGFEAIRVTTRPSFKWGAVAQIPESLRMTDTVSRRSYDVMKGGRFLGTPRPESLTKVNEASASHIEVVLNWFEELKARVR
jgi:serine/threonine-protein kinase